MNIQEFDQGMNHYFSLYSSKRFLCPTTLLFKEARINIIKFDAWLHKHFGEYEREDGISMRQLIKREFGKEAVLFIQKLI